MSSISKIWKEYRQNKSIGHFYEPWTDGFNYGNQYSDFNLITNNLIQQEFNYWTKGNLKLNWYFEIWKEGFLLGFYYKQYQVHNIAPMKWALFFYSFKE